MVVAIDAKVLCAAASLAWPINTTGQRVPQNNALLL
jgi:hypothetical protein